MTLDQWLREDPRRSFAVFYSRAAGDFICQIRMPGESPAEVEIHGDSKDEAIEAGRERLGLDVDHESI